MKLPIDVPREIMFSVLNTIYNDKDMRVVDHTDLTLQ